MLRCNRHFPIKWNSSEDNGFMEMEEPCWREMESQKALIWIGSFFFFFFFFSFAFPLNFLKISLGVSLVLQWHVLYLENLFLFFPSFTSNFSLFFFPLLLSLQEIIYTILSTVMEAQAHRVICLTECAVWEMGNSLPSALEGRVTLHRARPTLPSLLPPLVEENLWERPGLWSSSAA